MKRYLLIGMSPSNAGNMKTIVAYNINEAKSFADAWVFNTHCYIVGENRTIEVQIVLLQDEVIHKTTL